MTASAQAGVKIIAHQSVPVDTLSSQEIYDIFLGYTQTWENGEKIIILVPQDFRTSELFTKNILQMNSDRFRKHWRKLFFSGKAIPPKSFKDNNKLIQEMRKTKFAVSFITSDIKNEEIKFILIKNRGQK
jgi:ABC-type phosphate transport system substrate-binding protein